MKAFLAALVLTVGLAALSAFFTTDRLSLSAAEAYAAEGARVGEEGTAAARGWAETGAL